MPFLEPVITQLWHYALPAALTALLVVYPSVLVLYRLFFHPLRHFPGPKLAAATKWYEFFFDIVKYPGGSFMFEVDRMHKVYGPIVRINPHELHVKDSSWFESLYVGPTEGVRDKYPAAALMAAFGTVVHSTHRMRRAAVNPLFSRRAVRSSEAMIYSKVNDLLALIERQSESGMVEARTTFLAFTTDVICAHTFDLYLDLLHKPAEAADWRRNVRAITELTPLAKQVSWLIPTALTLPLWVFQWLIPPLARLVALQKYMHVQARAMIETHQVGDLKPQDKDSSDFDVFRTILFSSLPPEEKSERRIAEEGFVIIIAGGETTSRVLTNAAYFLTVEKERVLPRLREELRTIMPSVHDQPRVEELERLPYLTAVVKEALRITALVVSRLPLVSPQKDLVYKDWVIPAGAGVGMTLRDVLLDPEIYVEPHKFRPERWLANENPNMDRVLKYFMPFGRGSRICLGLNLAMAELYIAIASLSRRMDLQMVDTVRERDIDVARDCFVGEQSRQSTGVRMRGRRLAD